MRHQRVPLRRDSPLELAGPSGPDLEALATRIAKTAGPQRDVKSTPASPAPVTGFVTVQRWFCTHLCWEALPNDELCLIRRTETISKDHLLVWQHDPPSDSLWLPRGCDGIVDGLDEPDTRIHYAVLKRSDSDWLPLALQPDPPPFLIARQPVSVGPVSERLTALRAKPPQDSPLWLEIIEAAQAALSRTSTLELP